MININFICGQVPVGMQRVSGDHEYTFKYDKHVYHVEKK